MTSKKDKSLFEKYLEGSSTLPEEHRLFNDDAKTDDSMHAWSSFVRHNRRNPPIDFNQSLWESTELHNPTRRISMAWMSGAAAVLIALIIFVVNARSTQEQNFEKKKILLEEALAMTSLVKQSPNSKIIYEDDLIIIYATYK